MLDSFHHERELIIEIGRLLYQRGYVAANDGNISIRVSGGVLVTPAGVSKGRMTPDMLLLLDMEGNVLEGGRHPSSEAAMHLEVYRELPEVNAVVHAHPRTATAFAVCRRGVTDPYLSELVGGLGSVPCTPDFAMPSTDEVPISIRPLLQGHKALLIANHGALTWGEDIWTAFDRMEVVEHTADIILRAKLLGDPVALTDEEQARLLSLGGKYQAMWAKR